MVSNLFCRNIFYLSQLFDGHLYLLYHWTDRVLGQSDNNLDAAEPQTICIARSYDPNLRHWLKDKNNPILNIDLMGNYVLEANSATCEVIAEIELGNAKQIGLDMRASDDFETHIAILFFTFPC